MAVRQTVVSNTNSPKTLTINKLKGVDYSTSPFEVSTSRATSMKNMINEDGVNHKRHGWSEDVSLNKKIYEIGINNICGIHYRNPNVNNVAYIVACSSEIHVFKSNLEHFKLNLESSNKGADVNFIDEKDCIYIFYPNKLYKLILSDLRIESVHRGDSYVPTTTISINPMSNETGIRNTSEYANLLNKRRKNNLIGEKQSDFNVMYFSVDYSALDEYFKCITKQKITVNNVIMELPNQISSFPLRSIEDLVTIMFKFSVESSDSNIKNKKITCKIQKEDGSIIASFTKDFNYTLNSIKVSETNSLKIIYEMEDV